MTQESSDFPVIAIDGPSGSGKGTIARRVASSLGWHLLDSGALYRLVALAAQQQGMLGAEPQVLADIAGQVYDALMPMFADEGRFDAKALAVLRRSYVELGILSEEPDMSTLYTEAYLPRR